MADLPAVDGDISFRRMTRADLPLVHGWMCEEHVRRWFHEGTWKFARFEAEYGRYVDGLDPVDPYLALLDGAPFGYICKYDAAGWPELQEVAPTEPGTAGPDLLIGRREYVQRGLGTHMLRQFLRDVLFADAAVQTCIIDPNVANHAAIRSYEKVGFAHYLTVLVPGDTEESYLMRLPRTEWERREA